MSDEQIDAARSHVAVRDGLLLSPEGAATYAAYQEAAKRELIRPGDKVILFNCATGLKYPMPAITDRMDIGQSFEGMRL